MSSEAVATEERVRRDLDEIKANHSIKPGTQEYEAYLAAGYPDIGTVEHAQEIVDARTKDHTAYPWEVFMRAKAFLEAYNAKPEKWTTSHPPTDERGNVILPDDEQETARRYPVRRASRRVN